jgi:hypothetical protein
MTHPLIKLIVPWLVLAGLAGAAAAQPVSAAAGSGAVSPPEPAAASDARAQCTAAMNADPEFAKQIVKITDEAAARKRDADTVNAHNDAYFHIQKNERHVIYAYAAMWIIAAAFVIFLWRRQQVLQAEIAQLHRDLEAAAADKPAEGRP